MFKNKAQEPTRAHALLHSCASWVSAGTNQGNIKNSTTISTTVLSTDEAKVGSTTLENKTTLTTTVEGVPVVVSQKNSGTINSDGSTSSSSSTTAGAGTSNVSATVGVKREDDKKVINANVSGTVSVGNVEGTISGEVSKPIE